MANYQITEEQIKKLSKKDQIVENYLEEWFPEAFKEKIQVGKWYWINTENIYSPEKLNLKNALIYNNGEERSFIFNWLGKYFESFNISNCWENLIREATPEEVIEALEKECIKRFGEDWVNAKIEKCLSSDNHNALNNGLFTSKILLKSNRIWNKNGCIFNNGIWAEPLKKETFKLEVDNTYIFGSGEVSVSVVQNDKKFYNVAISKIDKTEVGKTLSNKEAFQKNITMLKFQSIQSLDILLSSILAVKKRMQIEQSKQN